MNLICKIFGHKSETVYEWRGRHLKNKRLHKWENDSSEKLVLVTYQKCKRCRKKLSNASRIYGGHTVLVHGRFVD